MDNKALGRRIKMARREKGFTGEQLAEACSINPTYLRQLESGVKTPSLPMFVTLCRALQASPSYLLADVLPEGAYSEMDVLVELWQKATPSQLKMITAMIRSALDSCQEP